MKLTSSFKKKINYLILYISIVLILTIGHYLNMNILIYISMLLAIVTIIFLKDDYKLNFAFFIMPWARLFRTDPDEFSFFTFLLPFILILILLNIKKDKNETKNLININLFGLVLISILLIEIGTINLFLQSFDKQIIVFISNLLFILIILSNISKLINFRNITIYYSIGLIFSVIVANFLNKLPHMYTFFFEFIPENYGRFSGMHTDPNFLSLQVLIAISSLLVLIFKEKKISQLIFYLIFLLTLICIGLLAVSKMYLLTLAFILLIFFININRKMNIKKIFLFLIIIIVTIAAFISTGFWNYIFNIYNERINSVNNLNDFTSGRLNKYHFYQEQIFLNLYSFLFGQGMNSKAGAPHNTFVQSIYQLGILGTSLLTIFFLFIAKISKLKLNLQSNIVYYIPLITILITINALDLLFADELPLFVIILVCSIIYGDK